MRVTNENLTIELGKAISAFSAESFSKEEYDLARVGVADLFCVAIAGTEEPVADIMLAAAFDMGGHEQASVFGHTKKISAVQAAKVNGTISHALDFDDSLGPFQGHPSASLLPAIFALAELRGNTYGEVLTSYLVGLEVGCAMSEALGVEHYYAGWHGTATIGRIAVAAAASHLIGLDAHKTSIALAIAGTESAGVKQSFGTMCKPYHAGIAAEGGVNAALLAERGMTASDKLLEGPLGFIELHDGKNRDVTEAYLNDRRPVELLAHKFHAACHNTHGSIELLLGWMESEGLTADSIEKIDAHVSQIGIDNAGKTVVNSGLEGKFSIPYTIARTLLSQVTGIEGYTDAAVNEPAVQALMKKVSLIVDDEHREAGLFTTLKVQTNAGKTLEGSYDPMDHIPALDMRRSRVEAKFYSLAKPILGESTSKALLSSVLDGDDTTTASSIMSLTQTALEPA